MKAIGQNVIVIASQNAFDVAVDGGLNLDGNSHSINNLRVASVSNNLECDDIVEGGTIIASKIAINPQNLITIGTNRYIRVQAQYIHAASSDVSTCTDAELEAIRVFEEA